MHRCSCTRTRTGSPRRRSRSRSSPSDMTHEAVAFIVEDRGFSERRTHGSTMMFMRTLAGLSCCLAHMRSLAGSVSFVLYLSSAVRTC
ncbi:hypothetical protein SEVIR_1G258650v4 [Setaria viridis]